MNYKQKQNQAKIKSRSSITIWDSANKGTYVKSKDGLIGADKTRAEARRIELDKRRSN